MVCSQGESLTLHTGQMKLFNAIAAAAVIGTSLITAGPAEASVLIDLNSNLEAKFNDGEDIIVIKKDGVS